MAHKDPTFCISDFWWADSVASGSQISRNPQNEKSASLEIIYSRLPQAENSIDRSQKARDNLRKISCFLKYLEQNFWEALRKNGGQITKENMLSPSMERDSRREMHYEPRFPETEHRSNHSGRKPVTYDRITNRASLEVHGDDGQYDGSARVR